MAGAESNIPLVKICGLTRIQDVAACETLGVDFLGFNFWPGSKRYLAPEKAPALFAAMGQAVPVGVFVNPSRAEIERVLRHVDLKYLQLHGDEAWDFIDDLPLPVIKAIPADRLADWGGLAPGWPGKNDRVAHWLIDTPAGKEYGGTGRSFDWSLVAKAGLPRPVFLAGGLGPGNLAEAIALARPYAVDLNSKVETAPGVKDPDRIRECLGIIAGMKSQPSG